MTNHLAFTRNTKIDFARGLAIIIMILANSAPYLLENVDIPFFMRFIFSTAAPIFIFLSGYSLNLAFKSNKSIIEIITRPIQILVLAILIDCFIWKIIPFQTFDVLYLIGFSQVIIIIFQKTSPSIKIVLLFLGLLTYIYVTIEYNYRFQILENNFSFDNFKTFSFNSSLQRMIFDGWFPLLPWFSVALLGYLAEQYNYTRKNTKYYFIAGIINFIGSYSLFIFFPASINYPREKYLEIFYPISIIFSIQLCGIFTLILIFINSKIELKSMVTYIGKSSLFVYLIHTIVIKNILTKFHFTFINIFVSFFINGILFLITIYISCTIISFLKPYLLNNKITKPILFILGL